MNQIENVDTDYTTDIDAHVVYANISVAISAPRSVFCVAVPSCVDCAMSDLADFLAHEGFESDMQVYAMNGNVLRDLPGPPTKWLCQLPLATRILASNSPQRLGSEGSSSTRSSHNTFLWGALPTDPSLWGVPPHEGFCGERPSQEGVVGAPGARSPLGARPLRGVARQNRRGQLQLAMHNHFLEAPEDP
jgi:hypothetical protein